MALNKHKLYMRNCLDNVAMFFSQKNLKVGVFCLGWSRDNDITILRYGIYFTIHKLRRIQPEIKVIDTGIRRYAQNNNFLCRTFIL